MLCSMMLVFAYSGTLVSMLVKPGVDIPVDSVADLVTQSKIPWKLEYGAEGLVTSDMEDETNLRYLLWTRRSGDVYDCYRSREDIKQGLYAVFCDKTTMKQILSEDFSATEQCNFYVTREDFYLAYYVVGFQPGSTLVNEANELILRLIEVGLVKHWLDVMMPNASVCLNYKDVIALQGEKIQPLSMKHLQGAFLLWVIGTVLGIVIAVTELTYWSYRPGKGKELQVLGRRQKENRWSPYSHEGNTYQR